MAGDSVGKKIIDYIKDNKLEAGLIGAAIFIVVLAIVVVIVVLCFCCCRRRRRRRGYLEIGGGNGRYVIGRGVDVPTSSLRSQRSEEGLHEAMHRQRMEREQTKRETALLNCQYYLRSNTDLIYVLESQLPDIGSRVSKSWFLVRPSDSSYSNSPLLLSMLPLSQHCRMTFDGARRQLLLRFFRALNHPYIHRIVSIDYLQNKELVAILEHFSSRGSLKDLIYQTTPALGWSTKYSVRRSSLKVAQIQNYGRQVLEAILFLHNIGVNPIGQIQSGNIYMEGGKCRLSGFENTFLGYRPRIYRLLKDYKEKIDSAMFGHLLYEIGSGRELTVSCPTESELAAVRHAPVIEVLKFIFYNESHEVPSIDEILDLPFFKLVKTMDLDRWNANVGKFQLTEEFKELIESTKRPRTRTTPRKRKSVVPDTPAYPVYTTDRNKMAKSLPPQTQKSKQSARQTSPSPPAITKSEKTERTALLDDIHKGATLKKTVTDDRSAPMI